MDSPHYAEVLLMAVTLGASIGWGMRRIWQTYRTRTPIHRDNDGVWRAARYPKGTRP